MTQITKFPAKFCLFAAPVGDEYIEAAKDYIKKHGLTSDDVRILKSDTGVTIWTKRDGVELNG